ncbi:MAG: polyketide synthase dehydratase domain-containing protein [Ignavibacteria bacterium]|nr:polyketide synthase dehydratase domain-containing protein [Ignavibacteria bacterium]
MKNAPAVKLAELKKDFKEIISADDFYKRVNQIGINYKKNFRGIKELFINGNSALAGIEAGEKLFTDNYNIHPALLDASFQTALSLLLDDNADCAFIPVGIEKIYFSKKAAGKLWSLAEIKNPDDSKSKVIKANITIFSPEGELIASVINLQLRKVSREEFISAADEIKDWFYEIAWERQNLPEASDSFVTGASDIRKYADSKLSVANLKNDLTDYKNGIDELNKFCISFIVNSFVKAGFVFSKGRSYEINTLSQNLNIADKYSKLFLRLLKILEENGIIVIIGNKIEIIKDIESGSQDDRLKSLLKNNPDLESEITLVSACGPELNEVLSGKTDALELLFPNGDFSTATRLYQDSPGFAAMNESVKFSLKI